MPLPRAAAVGQNCLPAVRRRPAAHEFPKEIDIGRPAEHAATRTSDESVAAVQDEVRREQAYITRLYDRLDHLRAQARTDLGSACAARASPD